MRKYPSSPASSSCYSRRSGVSVASVRRRRAGRLRVDRPVVLTTRRPTPFATGTRPLTTTTDSISTTRLPATALMIRSNSNAGSSPVLPSGASTPPTSLHGHPSGSSSASAFARVGAALPPWAHRLPAKLAGGPRANWRPVVVLLLLGALLGRLLPGAGALLLLLLGRSTGRPVPFSPPAAPSFRPVARPPSPWPVVVSSRPTYSNADALALAPWPSPPAAHLATSRSGPPFHVPSRQFLPPPPPAQHPAYHPPPPTEPPPGQAPNVVHYVYGYKPPREGEPEGELMPYYTYLAIRSALVNLKPDAIYLCDPPLSLCTRSSPTSSVKTGGVPAYLMLTRSTPFLSLPQPLLVQAARAVLGPARARADAAAHARARVDLRQ